MRSNDDPRFKAAVAEAIEIFKLCPAWLKPTSDAPDGRPEFEADLRIARATDLMPVGGREAFARFVKAADRRPGHPARFRRRNTAIAWMVDYIARKYGIHATQGERKNPGISASSVTSTALEHFGVRLEVRSVEDIWGDYPV